MEILEKILEEVTQYTKDVYECDLDDIVEYQRRNKEDKCTYIVQGIEEATEFIRSHMDETISEMEKVEKEKVTSAEIITRQIDGKPYYHIKFKKVGEDEYTIGYSSFKLDYVVKWLNDYFEFYGEAKVSCDDNGYKGGYRKIIIKESMICNWLLLKMEKYVWECIIIAKKNGGLENKREKDGIQISIMLLHGNLFQNHTRRKRNAEKGQNKRSTAPEAGREHPATRN